MKVKAIGGVLALTLVLSLLSACASGGTPSPTPDPKQVYTQVAQTVAAQITQAAALTPKATNTSQPSQTTAPTVAKSPTTAGTVSGTTAAGTPATPGTPVVGTPGTVVPTLPGVASSTPASGGVPTVPDKMTYVSQDPADGVVLSKGQKFIMTWTLKNTGTTTWNNKYWVRLYGGERMNTGDFHLQDTVGPNTTVKVSIEMTAPNNAGDFNTWWVISTPDLINFGSFNFSFKVK
jgi:hypothetical protein